MNKSNQTVNYILPAGHGAWDVTTHPFGGDFIRPKTDLAVTNLRPSHKEGWQLADCAYPPRKGVRTICAQGFEQQIPVTPIVDALTAQFSCRAASDPSNLVPALALALSTLGK